MCLTEQELSWDGLCMEVCEECMSYGYECNCGYHEIYEKED